MNDSPALLPQETRTSPTHARRSARYRLAATLAILAIPVALASWCFILPVVTPSLFGPRRVNLTDWFWFVAASISIVVVAIHAFKAIAAFNRPIPRIYAVAEALGIALRDAISVAIATIVLSSLAAVAGWVAIRTPIDLAKGYDTRNWTPVEASITTTPISSHKALRDEVACTYTPHGQAERISALMVHCGFSSPDAADLAAAYPPGSTVTAYVNPADPHEAVLRKGIPGATWGFLAAWPLFVAAAIGLTILQCFIWCSLIRGRRARPRPHVSNEPLLASLRIEPPISPRYRFIFFFSLVTIAGVLTCGTTGAFSHGAPVVLGLWVVAALAGFWTMRHWNDPDYGLLVIDHDTGMLTVQNQPFSVPVRIPIADIRAVEHDSYWKSSGRTGRTVYVAFATVNDDSVNIWESTDPAAAAFTARWIRRHLRTFANQPRREASGTDITAPPASAATPFDPSVARAAVKWLLFAAIAIPISIVALTAGLQAVAGKHLAHAHAPETLFFQAMLVVVGLSLLAIVIAGIAREFLPARHPRQPRGIGPGMQAFNAGNVTRLDLVLRNAFVLPIGAQVIGAIASGVIGTTDAHAQGATSVAFWFGGSAVAVLSMAVVLEHIEHRRGEMIANLKSGELLLPAASLFSRRERIPLSHIREVWICVRPGYRRARTLVLTLEAPDSTTHRTVDIATDRYNDIDALRDWLNSIRAHPSDQPAAPNRSTPPHPFCL